MATKVPQLHVLVHLEGNVGPEETSSLVDIFYNIIREECFVYEVNVQRGVQPLHRSLREWVDSSYTGILLVTPRTNGIAIHVFDLGGHAFRHDDVWNLFDYIQQKSCDVSGEQSGFVANLNLQNELTG
jgi:hypothetical protein